MGRGRKKQRRCRLFLPSAKKQKSTAMNMKKKLKILLLEDNAADVKLLDRALSKNFDAYDLKVVENKKEYLGEIEHPYDIVISDYALPDFDGMEALKIRNEKHPFLPFIITTGSVNEATAVQCMKEGADDYIIKEHITRIGEAVKRAIALKKAEYEKQQTFRAVQHLNRILKAIRNINQLITREHDEQKLIRKACDMFTMEQGYKVAFISLFDEKEMLGKTNACSGFPQEDFDRLVKALKKGDWPPCFRQAGRSRDMIHVRYGDEAGLECPLGKLKLSSSAFCRMLVYQGQKLGFITVSIPDDVTVNEEEKGLFREVTGDLAYALFNMRVERQNRDTAIMQKALFDIAHAVASEENLNDFLSRVFEIIEKVVDFDHGYIAIHDAQKHHYYFPVHYNIEEFDPEFLPDNRKGIIEYVRRRGKLTVLTATRLKELINKGIVEQIGPISAEWMGIPLVNGKDFIGVMALMNRQSQNAFSKKDEALMSFLSHQLALFIQRKDAVAKLRASNERYKNVMHQASDAIILCDRDGKIVDANEKALQSLGYTRDELLTMVAFDVIPEPLATKQREKYWDHFTTGNIFEFETVFKRKDHTTFPVEIKSGMVKIGNQDFVLSIARDITERKKSEEKIRQLSLGVEQSPASIVITDKQGNIQYVNKKFTEVSGYPAEEVMGKNLRFLKSGKMPDSLYKEIWVTISSGKEWHGEMINRRKDGSFFWELVSISPVKNEKGEITHYIAINEDITQRKEMEAELRRARQKAEESNRLKSEFLANMSHEIRTPMNGIIGFASLLEDDDLSAEQRQYYIRIIQNSTHQLLHIIDEILEVSELQTHQVEKEIREVNVNEILLGCFSKLDEKAKNKNISLRIKKGLPDEAALIKVDENKLHKVLHHLLENALKFTQEGFVEMGYRLKGDKLEFYVKDTGIGINPEAINLIFDEFSQEDKRLSRSAGGLGLGLSIVKGNVELLEGTLRVESEKGKGSIFFVEIPYTPVNPSEVTKLHEANLPDAETPVVLVVEDEEVNYQYLEILLKKYRNDIKILHAISGEEAVELCNAYPDIRLVLMDLKMTGIGGLEATRRIKMLHPEMVVVAQTAFTSLENREDARQAGCDAFLQKPTRKVHLFQVLDKYLKDL
jgi:PAS domain S-box-containing protein